MKPAVESLFHVEKTSRLSGDVASNAKILTHMASLCLNAQDLIELDAVLNTMSKKRGLIKGAIAGMVQHCINYLNSGNLKQRPQRRQLIDSLSAVTEGKIYLEVERAQLAKILGAIYEHEENDLPGAAKVICSVQVETFGSMDKRSRVDFILEQIRLAIATDEYGKATLISRKITGRTFDASGFEDLKLRYLELMIQLSLHNGSYLDCYRHYREVCQSPLVIKDKVKLLAALKMSVIFAILAPHTAEQQSMLWALSKDRILVTELPLYEDFLKTFLTQELVRWPAVEAAFGPELQAFPQLFSLSNPAGALRWRHLSERVVEHNLRTISSYYGAISMDRLASLLERSVEEAESTLCALIEKDMIYARIDRTDGIVTFEPTLQPDNLLNQWSLKVDTLLSLMVKTNYQISKEEMLFASALKRGK